MAATKWTPKTLGMLPFILRPPYKKALDKIQQISEKFEIKPGQILKVIED
jgi:hypothetical protein